MYGAKVVLRGHVLSLVFQGSAVLSMVGVEHHQLIAALLLKWTMHDYTHSTNTHFLLQLKRGHLGTGRNAPETPCAGMDAAVVCNRMVCSNAPHSVAVSLSPQFAWLYEQAGCVSRSRASL